MKAPEISVPGVTIKTIGGGWRRGSCFPPASRMGPGVPPPCGTMALMSAPRPAQNSSQSPADARTIVDQILDDAARRGASDIHLEPTAEGYELRYRIDGILQTISRHDLAAGRSLVGRLMVMGHLLTYRLDVPQEGRVSAVIPSVRPNAETELRLSVLATTHGLRAVVRMPAELVQPRALSALGLPPGVLNSLRQFAAADAGMLLVTGPAG